MTPKAAYYTPLLHVNSIEVSMRFYPLLGFETVDHSRHPSLEPRRAQKMGDGTKTPFSRASFKIASMPEVPCAGEHHGEPQPVRGLNHFLIAYRSSRLHHGRSAEARCFFHPVREREKRV